MKLFKNLFKKNKLNSEILSLVNLQDSIIMPPDTFFENNKNKELCKRYYQEYKEILSSKKTILSTHLKDTETDDIRVYIDILTSLELHIHDILDNPNKEEYNLEYITNLLARLKIYNTLLKSIEEESFLRLAALSSLKSTPFLSRNKKNPIDNEISRLQIQIFNAQKDTELISSQINSCLNLIEHLKLNHNTDFIKELSNRLNKYLQAFNIVIDEENIIYKQVKLEKYLFKNKNVLTDLNEEFKNLLNNRHLNRENRINQINILIDKYMAIKEYKRIEDPNLFYNLIEYKINTYEIDYNTYVEVLSVKPNYPEEKEILKEIFLRKVHNFMQNPEIFERYVKYDFYRNSYREFANIINKLLKNNEGDYDYEKVIKYPIITGLLYSIDDPIKVKNYFKYFGIRSLYLPKSISPLFEWEDFIPLETIMRLCDKLLSYEIIQSITNPQINLLYQIYKCLLDKVIKEVPNNYIYDGAKKFNINFQDLRFRSYQKLIKEYNRIIREGKKLIFPKTLKQIVIDNYIRYHDNNLKVENIELLNYYEFELNEGLEELILLDITSFNNNPNELEIPTTLKRLKLENINPECLTFKDYTESSLVNIISKGKKAFKEFISNIGNTQKLKFKGKTSVTTFSLNLEKLKIENKTDVDTIYNLLQEKVKEIYAKLHRIANYLEINIEEKEINLTILRELEDKISNQIHEYSQSLSEENPITYAINYAKILDERKINLERRKEMLNFFEICISIFTIALEKSYSREISDCLEQFRRVKCIFLLKTLSKTQEPLINDDTSKEEIDFFITLLLTKYRFKKNKSSSSKINFEIELIYDIVVRKYAGKGNYYEFLLKNPFLLELMISDDKFQVFTKYKENINKGIINTKEHKCPQEVPYSTFIEEAIKHEDEYDSSKTHTNFENFIHDLIPIYKLVKPNLENQFQNKKFKEANLTNNSDITLTRKNNLHSRN